MKDIRALETRGLTGETILVDQEGERDAGVLAEHARVISIAQADGGEIRAFGFERVMMFAQLRDMLAAEDSTVVT